MVTVRLSGPETIRNHPPPLLKGISDIMVGGARDIATSQGSYVGGWTLASLALTEGALATCQAALEMGMVRAWG